MRLFFSLIDGDSTVLLLFSYSFLVVRGKSNVSQTVVHNVDCHSSWLTFEIIYHNLLVPFVSISHLVLELSFSQVDYIKQQPVLT